jgi:hypothetical protein
MEVGDDVALVVPHKTGARAARHLLHVHAEHVALHAQAGDVHHAGGIALEDVDVGLLVGRQRAARGDRARHGLGAALHVLGQQQGGTGRQRGGRQQDVAKAWQCHGLDFPLCRCARQVRPS